MAAMALGSNQRADDGMTAGKADFIRARESCGPLYGHWLISTDEDDADDSPAGRLDTFNMEPSSWLDRGATADEGSGEARDSDDGWRGGGGCGVLPLVECAEAAAPLLALLAPLWLDGSAMLARSARTATTSGWDAILRLHSLAANKGGDEAALLKEAVGEDAVAV